MRLQSGYLLFTGGGVLLMVLTSVGCGTSSEPGQGDCDECSRSGAQVCDESGENGYWICGDWDGDDCLEWGGFTPCAEGESCEGAQCSGGCTDECGPAGDVRCAEPPRNGIEICADYNADSCLEWGGFLECQEGEICQDQVCSEECANECSAGQSRCDGVENGYRDCGDFDADPCLEWGDVVACSEGESCSSGACAVDCVDECAQGERVCAGSDGYRLCGDYDADPCLEWSGVSNCSADEVCGDGDCAPRGCIPEGEDCEHWDDCCEGFHCCPVFHICVENFWE